MHEVVHRSPRRPYPGHIICTINSRVMQSFCRVWSLVVPQHEHGASTSRFLYGVVQTLAAANPTPGGESPCD